MKQKSVEQQIMEIIRSSDNPIQLAQNIIVACSEDPLSVDWRGKWLQSDAPESQSGYARSGIFTCSFHRPTVGCGVVPVCHHNGRIYVAVIYNRYHDRRTDDQKKLANHKPHAWEMPAGFFDPRPPLGGQQGMYRLSKEQVDSAENKIFQGNMAGYKDVGVKENKEKKALPFTEYRGHENSLQCACKELEEETGLKVKNDDLVFMDKIEFYNEKRGMHQFGLYFMVDLGDVQQLPELQPQGEEVVEARWIAVDNINATLTESGLKAEHGNVPFVPQPYLQFYQQAILKARKQELEAASDIFNSAQAIHKALTNKHEQLNEIEQLKPGSDCVFGKQAHKYHQELLTRAKQLDHHYLQFK